MLVPLINSNKITNLSCDCSLFFAEKEHDVCVEHQHDHGTYKVCSWDWHGKDENIARILIQATWNLAHTLIGIPHIYIHFIAPFPLYSFLSHYAPNYLHVENTACCHSICHNFA